MNKFNHMGQKIHSFLCPLTSGIVRKLGIGRNRDGATQEQIEELYELIESYEKKDRKEGCDKMDAEKQ